MSKKIIYTFFIIGAICAIMIVGGIFAFKPTGYGSDSIIFFCITGLITVISLSIAIYNFIMHIREERFVPMSI